MLLLRSAAIAAGDTSPAAAAHWYRAALRLLAGGSDAERAQLLASLALALTFAGRLEEGRTALDESIALLPAGADEWAEMILTAARVELLLGDFGAAQARVKAAIDGFPRDTADRRSAGAERWRSCSTTRPASANGPTPRRGS
jgi:hypothetical protein